MCLARIFFVFPFHFGSRTFICAFTFFVSLPPSPCSHFYTGVVSTGWSRCFTMFPLFVLRVTFIFQAFVLSVICIALHFNVLWLLCHSWHSTEFTTMHNGASLMSSDPNGLLMPSGQMVSIEVWSNPTWFNSGTNHPADEKGVLSEIRKETWSHYTTTLHYTTLHYTTLHSITLHSITLHYITLHYTPLRYTTTTLHYIALHYTTFHCTTLNYTALHYTTLHYIPLHYATLTTTTTTTKTTTTTTTILHLHYATLHYTNYTTLHSTTLRWITLHYTYNYNCNCNYNYNNTTFTLRYTTLH